MHEALVPGILFVRAIVCSLPGLFSYSPPGLFSYSPPNLFLCSAPDLFVFGSRSFFGFCVRLPVFFWLLCSAPDLFWASVFGSRSFFPPFLFSILPPFFSILPRSLPGIRPPVFSSSNDLCVAQRSFRHHRFFATTDR